MTDTADETPPDVDDDSIEALRQLRQYRINTEGQSEFTDALAYIADLLEAFEDIEETVYDAADERVAEYESAVQDIRDIALEAKEAAEDAQQDARSVQSSVSSYSAQTTNRIKSFRDELADVQDQLDDLHARVDDTTDTPDASALEALQERLSDVEDQLVSMEEPKTHDTPPRPPARADPAEVLSQVDDDLTSLQEAGHIDDIASRLIRSRLDTLDVGESRRGPSAMELPDSEEVDATTPTAETNLHLGLIALAAHSWSHSKTAWATAGELERATAIPTDDLSRDTLSGVLSDLVRKHHVAERRHTDVANATWEYRITDAGRSILRDLGPHPTVSKDAFERYIGPEPETPGS